MHRALFKSSTRVGPRLFELSGADLHITGKPPLQRLDLRVKLKDIVPNFEKRHFVGTRFILNCVKWIAIVLAITSVAVRITFIPWQISVGFGAFTCLMFVREILKWIRPIDVALFRNRDGALVFEIMREKGEEEECDAFIAKLHAAIISCQDTAPNQAPLPTPMSVTDRADARSAPATGAAEL